MQCGRHDPPDAVDDLEKPLHEQGDDADLQLVNVEQQTEQRVLVAGPGRR